MRNAQRFFAPVFVILALFLASSFSFADVTGSILGVVRDPSQAVVKGVRVTVTNTQTNLSQDSVTGDDGAYHFLALPAGTYRVNATIPGFQQFNTTDIVLKVNDQLRVDINLRVGNVKEEVSIAADAVHDPKERDQPQQPQRAKGREGHDGELVQVVQKPPPPVFSKEQVNDVVNNEDCPGTPDQKFDGGGFGIGDHLDGVGGEKGHSSGQQRPLRTFTPCVLRHACT